MPAFINTEEEERLWQKAKERAKEEGKEDNWAYITGIYKKMNKGKVAGLGENLLQREQRVSWHNFLYNLPRFFRFPLVESAVWDDRKRSFLIKLKGKQLAQVSPYFKRDPRHGIVLTLELAWVPGAKKSYGFPTYGNIEESLAQILFNFVQKYARKETASPQAPGKPSVGEVTTFLKRLNTPAGRARKVYFDDPYWQMEPANRQRLDHYVGGFDFRDPEDDLYDPQGWNEEAWQEEYAEPLRRSVKNALDQRFGKDTFSVHVDEKGFVEVVLKDVRRRASRIATIWLLRD